MTHPQHGRRAAARPTRRDATARSAAAAASRTAAVSADAPRAPRWTRSTAPSRSLMSIATMSAVGGMLLATSVPALAVTATDSEVRASVYAPAEDTRSLRSQTLDVGSEVALAPIDVEGWDVEAAPPPIESQVAGLGEVALIETPRVVWPVDPSRTSDGFGPRIAPCAGCSTTHDGIDFNPGAGAPIVSIADGVVVTANTGDGGLGNYVEIQHNIGGELITSLYAHMAYGSMQVSVGQRVSAGQLVGAVGSTGQSTGPHLHLEMYGADGVRFDGMAWLQAHVTG
ncbi:M23 family metallopeptidase [Agromyces aurantiacus]|uniref:M23 family metallopeptidase n=1 Tax=Agromyces aurantiacus TaxID=165814 RepID=A0ABV9RAQ3_9MICO|nr:M23 family metallopeptidase [Agromyces aurantiacus]MBM7505325.1 murein DD-endopeptidase MepM/ murein hydrolase activator NlpD [Agromyces aurantiacus]